MNNVFIIVISNIIIVIVLYFLLKEDEDSWSCIEGNCKMTKNGDYTSKNSCEKVCVKKEIVKENSVTPTHVSYICDGCVCKEIEGLSGTYANMDSCLNKCCKYMQYTSPYLPYSPYSPYFPQSLGQFNRRNHRRGRRSRRSRRGSG